MGKVCEIKQKRKKIALNHFSSFWGFTFFFIPTMGRQIFFCSTDKALNKMVPLAELEIEELCGPFALPRLVERFNFGDSFPKTKNKMSSSIMRQSNLYQIARLDKFSSSKGVKVIHKANPSRLPLLLFSFKFWRF